MNHQYYRFQVHTFVLLLMLSSIYTVFADPISTRTLSAQPYFGLSRGVTYIHERYQQTPPSSASQFSPTTPINFQNTSWADYFSLFGGIGKITQNNYYYGVEIGTDLFFDSDRKHQKTTLSYKYNVSISTLIGKYINPNVLIYGRLGIVMSQLDATYTGQTSPTTTTQSGNDTAKALALGIGVQYRLHNHLSLRTEYRYLNYSNTNIYLFPEYYLAKISLSGQTLTLGVTYTL